MDFADQVADIRAAISFLAGEPNVDPQRIGIIGTSYGGGLVTWVAGNDPRVKCVAAQVAGMGGGRGPAAEQRAYELWTKQARGETEPVPFETGKLGGKMERYEHMRSNPVKSIGYHPI
ncbi:MAG: prolyl oligopeptidase family serine peptidase, partial [Verrucomicrobiae bacterium]|nr:prolyl oligopeptidase family serine peptidase [Verrucomicrobiae bacterium]